MDASDSIHQGIHKSWMLKQAQSALCSIQKSPEPERHQPDNTPATALPCDQRVMCRENNFMPDHHWNEQSAGLLQ